MGVNSSSIPPNHWSKGISAINSDGVYGISPRCEVIRQVSDELLWKQFLDSTAESFALSMPDLTKLLSESKYAPLGVSKGPDDSKVNIEDIKKYLDEWVNVTQRKFVDFMAVYTSVILLNNNIDIDTKIDVLYSCIDLSANFSEYSRGFSDEELLLALSSFDTGISVALNLPPAPPTYLKDVCANWLKLIRPQSYNKKTLLEVDSKVSLMSPMKPNETSNSFEESRVSKTDFFEFCNNRQLNIRSMLEQLSTIPLQRKPVVDKAGEVPKEVPFAPKGEKSGKAAKSSVENTTVKDDGNLLNLSPSGGDEWTANPPWKKMAEKMLPQSYSKPNSADSSKPDANLRLKWVHGYRGYDCRNNVFYTDAAGTNLFYPAAALGIVLNRNDPVADQSYFNEHEDDVLCTAVYQSQNGLDPLLATGELGKSPSICVYSYNAKQENFTTLSSMKGFHTRGVSQLCFSSDGKLLYSVGIDYTIAVYNVNRASGTLPASFGKLVASIQGPKGKIMHLCECSIGNTTAPNSLDLSSSYCFATCGEKHVSFWQMTQASGSFIVKEEVGKLNGNFKPKLFLSCAKTVNNQIIVGTADGDVAIFNDKRTLLSIGEGTAAAHNGAVSAIWTDTKNAVAVSGGADGGVIIWSIPATADSDKEKLGYNIPVKISAFKVTADMISTSNNRVFGQLGIRSICMSADRKKIVLGMQNCMIIELTANAGDSFPNQLSSGGSALAPRGNVLIQGHFKDEVWGLSVRNPTTCTDGEYCTVGDDGILRVWSADTRSMKKCFDLGFPARACAYSSDGLTIAVGLGADANPKKAAADLSGALRVYRNDDQFTLMYESKEAKKWISEIKFSPDGRTLAIGSHDNNIYLYNVAQQYARKGKFSKHSSAILHFDFSMDGHYLQSNCQSYELLYCDVTNGKQVTNASATLRDIEWSEMTCRLSWGTLGIWKGNMDGSDINSVARSPSGKLLASGDDFGKVKLFRYPAIDPAAAQSIDFAGHSSHVTMVRWCNMGANKSYLISTGGEDKCIFQWEVIEDASDKNGKVRKTTSVAPANVNAEEPSSSQLLDVNPSGGDEFMAVKPWLGAIVTPTAWTNADNAKKVAYFAALKELSNRFNAVQSGVQAIPNVTNQMSTLNVKAAVNKTRQESIYGELIDACKKTLDFSNVSGVVDVTPPTADDLELHWVNGYRGYDCRNNAFYAQVSGSDTSPTKVVVFFAAALGIVLYPSGLPKNSAKSKSKEQKFFRGHSDDIMCMAVVPNNVVDATGIVTSYDALVVTGQIGKGNVYVWSAGSLRTIASIATNQKTVLQVAFTGDNRLVVSQGEDNTIVVSDWRSQSILVSTSGDPALCCHLSNCAVPGRNSFVAVGDKMLRLYSIEGKNLNSSKISVTLTTGTKSTILNPQIYWCVCSLPNDVHFVGCDDGSLYVLTAPASTAGKKKDEGNKLQVSFVVTHAAVPYVKGFEVQEKAKKSGAAAAITSIVSAGNRLYTGAKDGSIAVWDLTTSLSDARGAPVALYRFNVTKLDANIFAPQIVSLSVAANGKTLLVGTRGCELMEIDISESSGDAHPRMFIDRETSNTSPFLIRSHCNSELWGLAVHPTLPVYCTVGDDKTMRFHDIHSKNVLGVVPIGGIARAVAYHPSGSLVAVGFGGRVGRGKEPDGGKVHIYATIDSLGVTLEKPLLCEAVDMPKQWVSDVKFSPDGSTLAVGAHDNLIYLYNVTVDRSNSSNITCSIQLKCKFTKHNSSISHFDFSMDGRYLQSNCQAYELLYCDVTNGKQITSASQFKDMGWSSWTCALGWPVQGIWEDGADGSDINTVCRSHSGHIIASGDDCGLVKLFRYPCTEKPKPAGKSGVVTPNYLRYPGHSSHVMNVRWSVGDEFLITVGGDDKCIFQWKHIMISEDISAVDDDGEDAKTVASSAEITGPDEFSSPSGGDECGAVKPYLGAIRAPSHPPAVLTDAPNVKLGIKWVHGYTSAFVGAGNVRVSSNLFYNTQGDCIYPAAAVGVKLSQSSDAKGFKLSQAYFNGHDDDIMCLAISPNRRFVATGQCATTKNVSSQRKGKGSIHIWDSLSCTLLTSMVGCHQRAVTSLAFAPSNDMLLSVGQDDSFTHTVWQDVGGGWTRVREIATCKGEKTAVLFSKWLPSIHPKVCENEMSFVSGGGNNIQFWKLEGATLSKKAGRFGNKYKQNPLTCAGNILTKDGWRLVCGSSTGDIYCFDENRDVVHSIEKAHSGPVLCMCDVGGIGSVATSGPIESGVYFLTGGSDGVVKLWSQALQPVSSFEVGKLSLVNSSIGAVDIQITTVGSDSTTKLLIGTYGGEIIDCVVNTVKSAPNANIGTDLTAAKGKVLLYSHYKGELWGLATHPIDSDMYATVGDDGTLRVWSVSNNCMITYVSVGSAARSVAWDSTGCLLAVGLAEKIEKKGGKSEKSKGKSGSAAVLIFSFHYKNAIASLRSLALSSGGALDNILLLRASGCDSSAWISDIKFSPRVTGEIVANANVSMKTTLAIGTHDKKLIAYDLPEIPASFLMTSATGNGVGSGAEDWGAEWSECLTKKPKFVFNKHSSAVLHFDFSMDGRYLQSNCQAYELLYCDVTNGKQVTSASLFADYNNSMSHMLDSGGGDGDTNMLARWSTQTCVLGWPVQGIWPSGADGTDVNACDRSNKHEKYIATADDFGYVKVFRYPCVKEGTKFVAGNGHSSHVTSVRWAGNTHSLLSPQGFSNEPEASESKDYLVSAGGNDKCIFVWELDES